MRAWMTSMALVLCVTASARAGDVRATLDSSDGSSAFVVRDADSNELARVQSDGRVGIGTNAPVHALDVAGDVNLSGDLRVDGAAVSIVTNVTASSPLASSGGTAPNLTLQTADAAQAGALSSSDWNTFNAKVPTNRTIATTAPLTGGGALSEDLTLALPAATAEANGYLASNDWSNFSAAFGWGNHADAGYATGSPVYIESDPVWGAASDGVWTAINAKVDGSGTASYVPKFTASGTVGDSAMVSDASGNVGIGTTTPGYKLDVNGAINGSSITIGGTPVSTSTDTYWSVSSGGGGKIQYSGGNVGVGAENPHASALLEVAATDKGMLTPRMTRDQRDAIGTPATGLLIYQTDNTPGFYFYDGAQWSSISAGAGAVTAVTASSPLASSGGATPNLSIPLASSSQTGALTSADWVLFNAKVPTNRTITTTAPLTGGGALSGNLTLALPAATTAVNGYLASNDWSTFNAKVPTNRTITTTAPLTGGGALSGNLTLALPAATTAVNGYLASNDWSAFNAKVPTNRSITASTGLTGGGTLAADRTISLTGQALALHNLNAAGLVTRTGADAITSRVIAVSGNGIAVANSNGVSGNPTLSLDIGTGATQVAAGNHTHADYSTPPGAIHAYGGASAPSGYLLCNGAAVSRTTYAALFSAIGTNYGVGDGSTTFNVPNLQGRVPVGLSAADAEFDVRGETGGAKTHTLASNEIPAHVHLVDPPNSTTTTNGSHTHSYNDQYRGTTVSDDADDRNVASSTLNDAARTTGSGGSHTHTLDIPAFNSGSSGGGAAHNNLQPYLVVNYIIKH